MNKLFKFIFILACGVFLFNCEEDQSIKSQHQNLQLEVAFDPQSLTEQDEQNTRTQASTVALNKVSIWLKRDQWAGGRFRFVLIEKESEDVIVRSVWVSVVDLPTNSFARVNFNGGNRLTKKGVTHKINLEFSHVHDDVGKVFAAASLEDEYEDGCGPKCSYDLTFETSNRRSDGVVYVDQSQLLNEKSATVNRNTSITAQEFVPQESN